MAEPVITAIPADTWTKVATNVTCVNIGILTEANIKYMWTYRLTGNPAPAAKGEGVIITPPYRPFASSENIDFYIYSEGAAGSVRVDVDFQAPYLIDA